MPAKPFQAVAIVMTMLCFVSAVLQYNDPDPIQWAGFYLVATFLSGWAAFRPATLRWQPPAVVAVIGIAWALMIFTHMHGRATFADLFKTMEAKTPTIEESRETLGLLIVAVWMLVLAFRHRRSHVA